MQNKNSEFYACDICNVESESVRAGRWIFYCPSHKQIDVDKTYDNEIAGRDMTELLADGELSEIAQELF